MAAPSLTDRALARVFPGFALRRWAARSAMAAASGGYAGGKSTSATTVNWKAQSGSADADLLPDLPILRERSRDLVRNNPLAGGAISTNVTSVVGAGLRLKPQIDRKFLKLSDEQANEWESEAKRIWRRWCKPEECDLTGVQSFEELQALALRSTLESGDMFSVFRMVPAPGTVFQTRLEFIEADRCSNPSHPRGGGDTVKIAGGVEVDENGKPVVYHICNRHPTLGVSATEWKPYKARDERGNPLVLHIYERLRIGQRRGAPYLAPVIEALKQLSNYSEAELDAAVLTACLTVFVKSQSTPTLPQNTGVTGTASATDYYKDIDMQKASIVTMRTGDEIQIVDPARPNENFDPFFLAICRQIGVALQLPYEVLIKHFTASYSAARAAMLEAWRAFSMKRDWLAYRLCQPVWEAVLAEAVALGYLKAPGFFSDPLVREAWCTADWIGPAAGQIDPTKETDAAATRMREGLSTLDAETAGINGGDWEANLAQRKRELAALADAGLRPAPGAAPAGGAQPPQPPQGDDEETGDLENKGGGK